MKPKLLFIFLIFIFTYSSVSAVELRHSIGGQIAFYGYSTFPDDPYSLPSGVGLFYEISKITKPSFFLGADLLWYGFVSGLNFYSGSMMLIPSVSLGYKYIFYFSHHSNLSFSPFISYGQYIRSIETEKSTMLFSRPVITGGLDIAINTEIKTTSSLGLFVSVIMDDTPVIMPGFRVKTGYSWGSVR